MCIHHYGRNFKFTRLDYHFMVCLSLHELRFLVPSSARTIIPFKQIIDSSTLMLLKVMTGQIFKVDPLS